MDSWLIDVVSCLYADSVVVLLPASPGAGHIPTAQITHILYSGIDNKKQQFNFFVRRNKINITYIVQWPTRDIKTSMSMP